MADDAATSNFGASDKRQARRLLRERLAGLSPEQRHVESAAIADLVAALPEWADARTVMLYLSLPDEVETSALFARAFREGKSVAVPRITDTITRRMSPVAIQSLAEEELEHAHFGVRIPTAELEAVPIGRIDLVLVPGLGFSRRGERIGRGMGYYDTFLASDELRAPACGVGFAEQIVDELPSDERDRPMDLLVTPHEVLRFR